MQGLGHSQSARTTMDVENIQRRLREFSAAREWNQFHSPKNLSMAMTAEVGELVEIFQWLTEDQSRHLSTADLERVSEELADAQIYLLRIADVLNIALEDAVLEKISLNDEKYPISRAFGSSRKYTDL